uniref:Uncharacterized protein n=1 Tax=Timspurckia oligopyrenoides TaxID=708627 RepID=A0A7S1ETY8_9RHOD
MMFSGGSVNDSCSVPTSIELKSDVLTVELLFYPQSVSSNPGGRLSVCVKTVKSDSDSGETLELVLKRMVSNSMKNQFGMPMKRLPGERRILRRFANDVKIQWKNSKITDRPDWVRLGQAALSNLRPSNDSRVDSKAEKSATNKKVLVTRCFGAPRKVSAELQNALAAIPFSARGPSFAAALSVSPTHNGGARVEFHSSSVTLTFTVVENSPTTPHDSWMSVYARVTHPRALQTPIVSSTIRKVRTYLNSRFETQ